MLLGVLLALAAGTIVIYIVSQATSSGPSLTTVVVSTVELPANTVLVAVPPAQPDPNTKYVVISQAFTTKQYPADAVPADAFPWKNQDDLNAQLTNYVVVGDFLQGEILRQPDSDHRLARLGAGGAAGSITNKNPGQIKAGQVLVSFSLNGPAKSLAVTGDYVDLLAVACNIPNKSGCVSQTTMQNLYVYDVNGNSLVLAVSHDDALRLLELKQIASEVDVAIRKPDDHGIVHTSSIDTSTIASYFGF